MNTLITEPWEGYTLLATGNRRRLEQVGSFSIERPEPNALWDWSVNHTHQEADAIFHAEDSRNPWQTNKQVPADGWWLPWEDLRFKVKLTPFRHLGVFPEQAAQWRWLREQLTGRTCNVLNLFGYTGAATVVAARAGATVCHVDASKPAVSWAADNAKANNVEARWIVDDARKFVTREIKRGNHYDIILLDPPVFGRGTKGEVWRLEDDLAGLLTDIRKILTEDGRIWLTFYATDLYPLGLQRLAEEALGQKLNLGQLALKEAKTGRLLQTGYYLVSA